MNKSMIAIVALAFAAGFVISPTNGESKRPKCSCDDHEHDRSMKDRINDLEHDLSSAMIHTDDYSNHSGEFLRVKRFEVVTNVAGEYSGAPPESTWMRGAGGSINIPAILWHYPASTNYITNIIIGTEECDFFKAEITSGADARRAAERIGL